MADRELGEGIVFLVASHRNPEQVARLARRLRADLPGCAIVIHHDRSKSQLDAATLPSGTDLLADPVNATWGTASLVEMTVRCLEFVEANHAGYRFVVFLSGQDYPLRTLSGLPQRLAAMKDGCLNVEMPAAAEPLRYELTWFRLPDVLQNAAIERIFQSLIFHLNPKQTAIRFAAGRLGCTVGLRLPSPIPRSWRIYQGSQWWVLGNRAIETFLRYKRERPGLYAWFMKRTIVPDEGIFQTFLLNTPELEFAGSELRYIRWDDRNSGSPATLGFADFETLRASGRTFARKFDGGADARILDALDAAAAADR